jgi:hypothetical protein
MTQPPGGTSSLGSDPNEKHGLGQSAEPLGTGARSHDDHPSIAGLSGSTVGGGDSTSPSQGSADDAKSTAREVAGTTKGEAKQVAGTAAESAKQVAETAKTEAKQQAVSLLDTVRSEAGSQVGTQQNRIADALHGLAQELGGMASASDQSGPLTDLAQQASRKGGEVAHWLQDREPADVLESVRSYGRRHPVTFLALCGLAGIVAGRLTRSTVATRTSLDTKDNRGSGSAGQLRSNYVTAPVTAPVEPAPVSTGVYGGSVETTAPADPYAADPYDRPPAGPGYIGTVPDSSGGLSR